MRRTYRRRMYGRGVKYLTVCVGESDLRIGVSEQHWRPGMAAIVSGELKSVRGDLQTYLALDPAFGSALEPHVLMENAPAAAVRMAAAAAAAGVGPMAAVAGEIAAAVGKRLIRELGEDADVLIENGGDLWLWLTSPRLVVLDAGTSPLSGRLGIRMGPCAPAGVCTSAGTVGPSLSLGRADAFTVVATDAALADAAATAGGNMVQSPDDVELALTRITSVPGVSGAVVIIGNLVGALGKIELAAVN